MIAEVCELFDRAAFLPYRDGRETAVNQVHNEYIVIRAGDLWWHDLDYLCRQVARQGVRPWMWADAHWFHGGEYERQVPKSVLQGNWWYSRLRLNHKITRHMPELGPQPVSAFPVRTYQSLDRAGYDQILTASNWSLPENFRQTVAFARRHLSRRHVLGFLQTTWKPMLPEFRQLHLEAIDQAAVEIARWRGRPARVPPENPDAPLAIPPKAGARVGIYYANPGAPDLSRNLNQQGKAWNAFILPRLDRTVLKQCAAVIIARTASPFRVNRAAASLRRWVAAGGRLMLMYDAAGWNKFAVLFPEIGRGIGKCRDKLVRPLPGSRPAGKSFRHHFADHLRLRRGRAGQVLARDAEKYPVVVGGKFGRGRVVLSGLFTAGTPGPAAGSGELRHFEECLQWLGAENETLKL